MDGWTTTIYYIVRSKRDSANRFWQPEQFTQQNIFFLFLKSVRKKKLLCYNDIHIDAYFFSLHIQKHTHTLTHIRILYKLLPHIQCIRIFQVIWIDIWVLYWKDYQTIGRDTHTNVQAVSNHLDKLKHKAWSSFCFRGKIFLPEMSNWHLNIEKKKSSVCPLNCVWINYDRRTIFEN